MPVGDVNSSERGSGARYNDGKPDLSLIPWWAVYDDIPSEFLDTHTLVLSCLGAFQRTHNVGTLRAALRELDTYGNVFVAAARVFEYGAKKYASWNWAKGMKWSIPLACAARHMLAVAGGEELDPESGEPHFGHAACNIMMLMHYIRYYPEGNDLPTSTCFGRSLSGGVEPGLLPPAVNQRWAYE